MGFIDNVMSTVRKTTNKVEDLVTEAVGIPTRRDTNKQKRRLDAMADQARKQASKAKDTYNDFERRIKSFEAETRDAAKKLKDAGLKELPSIGNIVRDGRVTMAEAVQLTVELYNYTKQSTSVIAKDIARAHARIRPIEVLAGQVPNLTREILETKVNAAAARQEITDGGLLPAGDMQKDLANGSLFVRGRRIDVLSLFLTLNALKTADIVVRPSSDEKMTDYLLKQRQRVTPVTGVSVLTPAQIAAALSASTPMNVLFPNALTVFLVDGSGAKIVSGDSLKGALPAGTTAAQSFDAQEIALVPSVSGFVKGGIGALISSYRSTLTSIAPFFGEAVSSYLGYGESADINLASAK